MGNPLNQALLQEGPLSPPIAKRVTFTDPATATRFLSGIASGFVDTYLTRAFITEMDDTPSPYPSPLVDQARVYKHFAPFITSAVENNAILLEAGNFSALAVWETTTFTGKPITSQEMSSVGPIRRAWRTAVPAIKEKYLGTRIDEEGNKVLKPHYHLGFLARNPEVPGVPGAISAVVKPMLQEAVKEGVPVWLEATYEHAVAVYTNYGFRVVEIVTVGQGSRDSLGWPEEGGSGVKGWMMIYDGHLRSGTER